ncbi:MAG: ribonuclease Y [Coriobacteriales bacterium]|jgi:ribonuclease Y
MPEILWIVIFAIVGIVVGFVISSLLSKGKSKKANNTAEDIIKKAEHEAASIRKEAEVEAKDKAYKIKSELDKEIADRKKEINQQENRLIQRENSLDKRSDGLDKREHQISSLQGQVEKKEQKLNDQLAEVTEDLERISAMSKDEAREELINRVKGDMTKRSASIIRQAEAQTKIEADRRARSIISTAIQRVAADHTSERTISTVPIPSDDLKGRIIGREGRNIRTFEQITGVNLIIDDTPEVVVISSFDPVRREIGRITLENLIADGRIHPARIEEMYSKATKFVNQQIQDAGEKAAYEVGIHDLDPELIRTLGRLKFRTSYGQNVLKHSLEVAYLTSIMASELGIDPVLAKRAGLLHDIGKAIDHEVEGSHAVIGADLARRYGEPKEVVHAIEAHHNDVEPATVIAVLVQSADAISAARPGARSESMENYIKRLEKLESIANSHDGVERTYAMQAGREIRVMVEPEKISDAQATVLAHDIATEIEEQMQYPGQIKVLVIRESRAMDYAK